jgi:hypothetical protein
VALKSFGTTNVAWEERVNFERFRTDRLSRIKGLLKESELGALLTFDMNNIRYQTATIIGTWVQDKLARFALLPQDDEPVSWHFGSAARHHQLYCPLLGERSRAGISTLRGATPPEAGLSEDVAKKVRTDLEQRGIQNEPIGVEVVEMEEKVVVTKDGVEVITRFPAEEFIVAGLRYFTASGPLPTEREAQSHLNPPSSGIPAGIAGAHP